MFGVNQSHADLTSKSGSAPYQLWNSGHVTVPSLFSPPHNETSGICRRETLLFFSPVWLPPSYPPRFFHHSWGVSHQIGSRAGVVIMPLFLADRWDVQSVVTHTGLSPSLEHSQLRLPPLSLLHWRWEDDKIWIQAQEKGGDRYLFLSKHTWALTRLIMR